MQLGASFRQRTLVESDPVRVRHGQMLFWLIVLALAMAMFVRTSKLEVDDILGMTDMSATETAGFRANLASLGISQRALSIVIVGGTLLQSLLTIILSAILLWKRRGTDWFAFYIALTFVAGIGAVYPPDLHQQLAGEPIWLTIGFMLTALSITSLFLLPMLFPTGTFVPRWVAIPAAFYVLMVFSFIAFPERGPFQGLGWAVEVGSDLLLLILGFGTLIYRYRWKSNPVQRQQMKLGAIGVVIALSAFLIGDAMLRNIDGSFLGVLAMLGFTLAVPVFSLAFPICLTVAILRYRLFDIDLFISRTLVWILMTLLVIAAYIGIVFGIGSRFEQDRSNVLTLIALGLTAVLFQPMRAYVQRGINRLLYGDRDDPYQVVRKLAADLSDTVQPIEALRATVQTLTEALRLPYAAITLEPGASPVAAAGMPGMAEILIPLSYQSQSVGELIVSPRGGAREFDATDLRLLNDLTQQIGVVAHNVRLTNDLQLSRERIVTAREEERRRLRRDLHDGLGAQLAALTLHAGAMKATIRTDPDAAVAQATELQQELRTAIADIRRLVQGLRPASLDDLGLIGALQNRISTVNLGEGTPEQQHRLFVTLVAPEPLGDLPAAVEVAIYHIVDEALTNVVRYANAARCDICIARDAAGIRLTIEDDGVGIPTDRISGVGLQSMRERASELGGTFAAEPRDLAGTRIVAELPMSGGGG